MSETAVRGKRVLVTGGAGFIGSYVVENLVRRGAVVSVVDNLETGRIGNLESVKGSIRFMHADLRDRRVCEEAVSDVDVVINMAARALGFQYSMTHDAEMLTCNTQTAFNMLEAANERGVQRFVVTSTSCVYPDESPCPTHEDDGHVGQPESVNRGYGWAKRMSELQAQYYAGRSTTQFSIVRPTNAYGPRYAWIDDTSSHVIPSLVKKVMEGSGPISVWGSGDQRRNFVHVIDVAEALIEVGFRSERAVPILPINLGFEDTISIRDLVEKIRKLAGREDRPIVYDPSKAEGRPVKSVDSSRLRALVPGLKKRIDLDEGLREMLGWYNQTFGSRA